MKALKYKRGEAEPCRACGVSDRDCLLGIFDTSRPCCGRCGYTATHNQNAVVEVDLEQLATEPERTAVAEIVKVTAELIPGGYYTTYLIVCEKCGTVESVSAYLAADRCNAPRTGSNTSAGRCDVPRDTVTRVCTLCDGAGELWDAPLNGGGRRTRDQCPACGGSGETEEQ